MHETKEGFMEICLTACMLWFIRSCNRMKEKAKTVQFHFWSKSSVSKQRRFRARFKDGTVPSRNTIIYLTVEYLIGWCVSISHKSFSGRKKHVRTAEKVRLIRTFVNNDPKKSYRRCGAPWAAWASLLLSCWKMTQGRCTNCTILLQKDVSPVHAATVTIKWLRSGSGSGSSPEAPPSRGHRGLRTLPHQFSSYGVMWRKRPASVNPETSQS